MQRQLPNKFISINGVLKINPEYTKAVGAQATTVAEPKQALAIISTEADMKQASEATKGDCKESDSYLASKEIIKDADHRAQFGAEIKGEDLLNGLYNVFAKHEVPVGLINKLLQLSEYKLEFIVDDSGSTTYASDVTFKDAGPYVQKYNGNLPKTNFLTRWQEEEDRLHTFIDFLAYIPTKGIRINYLNEFYPIINASGKIERSIKNEPLILTQAGKTPEEFAADAHQKISNFFNRKPVASTPLYASLTKAMAETKENTMYYLLCDGNPDGGSEEVKKIVTFIKNRKNPKMSALTLMSCTNVDEDTEWMKTVEEEADYVSELDDYIKERAEVLNDHGPIFPYSKGMWLICNLIAAICPEDLDKIDESVPFTKFTMETLLGRKLNLSEYKEYFDKNPNARKFTSLYVEFLKDDQIASTIIKKITERTGIKDASKMTEMDIRHVAAFLQEEDARKERARQAEEKAKQAEERARLAEERAKLAEERARLAEEKSKQTADAPPSYTDAMQGPTFSAEDMAALQKNSVAAVDSAPAKLAVPAPVVSASPGSGFFKATSNLSASPASHIRIHPQPDVKQSAGMGMKYIKKI